MMYKIRYSKSFDRALKKMLSNGADVSIFKEAVYILEEKGVLPAEYKQHTLRGSKSGQQEAHLDDDWLIVWVQHNDKITFIDTGTHQDLFG